ncbi:MAG TPA: hypothetical protein VI168_09535 [Croceibacterium sp.]
MASLYPALLVLVAIFCLVQAVRDFRHRHYVWSGLNVISAAILLLIPFPTHSVAIDLPRP